MRSLVDLPREIHHQILSYLLSDGDIAALSTQCRSLHEVCDMESRKRVHQITISPDDASIETAFILLKEILKRPVLGQYVRQIACTEAPPTADDYTEGEQQREPDDEEMQLLRAAALRAGFVGEREDRIVKMLVQEPPDRENGLERITQRVFTAQALAAILITVSPSLTSLHLAQPFCNWKQTSFYTGPDADLFEPLGNVQKIDYPLASLLHETDAQPEGKPYLPNLSSVHVIPTGDDVEGGLFYQQFDFKGVLALVNRLPSIESVGTELLEEYVHGWPGPTLDPCRFSRISIHNS